MPSSLRCGYVIYSHYCQRDKAGAPAGTAVEIMAEACKRLGRVAEFTEELYWNNLVTALQERRVDVVIDVWFTTQERIQNTLPSLPIYYDKLGAWVRPEDAHREQDISALNREDIRVPYVPGETSETVANELFPRARKIALSRDTPLGHLVRAVATGQGDVAIVDNYIAKQENALLATPLINRAARRPLRVAPLCFLYAKTAFDLRDEMDGAIESMIADGTLESTFRKYHVDISEGVTHFTISGLSN